MPIWLRNATPFLPALLLLLPVADGTAQQAPPAAAGAPAAAAAPAPDVLRPGDALRLRIWREPDLSGDFTIDDGGVVTLPKVGPLQATAETIDELKARLVSAYRVYLKDPTIEVVPLRRIQVSGAVRAPGLFTVDPTVTIWDVVALAGGATPQGRQDRVILVRGGRTTELHLSRDGRPTQPLRSGDQVLVPERKLVSRNPGVIVGAVSATASMIWAIARLNP